MNAVVTLLQTLLLPDFPSASAVEFQDNKLYLIGDDASCILVLDRDYHFIKTIPVTGTPAKRIAKTEKPDFEASALINLHGQNYLMASGSLATPKRRKILLLPLPEGTEEDLQLINYPETFVQQLQTNGIHELNIEGATVIGDTLVLSNRGNNTYPLNQLILTRIGFWENDNTMPFSVVPLTLLTPTAVFNGVSELCYVPGKDLLLCTLSSEVTTNAYDDGEIGDSYIGWITDISQKLSQPQLVLSGLVNLPEIHEAFKQEKIEGICLESLQDNTLLLHLVSDNDAGESRLFKVCLTFITV